MAETAIVARNIFGEKKYQIRARQALPILVRQALSRQPIFYEDLAEEISMPNPRNLNYVLGSIGVTILEWSKQADWEDVPHIESIVINQHQQLPGEGFDEFLAGRTGRYQNLSLAEKREYLRGYWSDVFAYPRWREFLSALRLPFKSASEQQLVDATRNTERGEGGEGEEHRKLKEMVAQQPKLVGLPASTPSGRMEAPLPSGDSVDVLFFPAHGQLAVEVKSRISGDADIARGLFQCVKYRAILEAVRGFNSQTYSVESILVVGRKFPTGLRPMKNSLGVRVIEIAL